MTLIPTNKAALPSASFKKAINHLKKIVGSRFVLTRPEELATYECDACLLVKSRPCAVVLPATTEEVSGVVKLCNQYGIPFVARGAGTGLSGGALPITGGIIIGLNRLNKIIDINYKSQTATVEAGVVNGWLNNALKEKTTDTTDDISGIINTKALFFAPDPSSQSASTIGGNIAENAGGIHCLKYGVTTNHILGLEVVLPDGRVTWLGGKVRASQGLDLVGLMVGSEGTLGIVTQAVVKLTPQPTEIRTFLAAFDSVDDAGDAVSYIVSSGLVPAALEFMDAFTAKAVNEAFNIGFPESCEAVLLAEVDGHPLDVDILSAQIQDAFTIYQASQIREARTETERLQLWRARKLAVAAYGRYLPAFYLHDAVIPRSQLTSVLKQIHQIAADYNLVVGNVFHAGDGNLHPNILFDPDDKPMIERMLEGGEKMLDVCLAVGGTLSGEHGIGLEKSEYMDRIFSEADLSVMKQIKQLFDPLNLANPQKIFPMRKGCGEINRAVQNPLLAHSDGACDNGVWV